MTSKPSSTTGRTGRRSEAAPATPATPPDARTPDARSRPHDADGLPPAHAVRTVDAMPPPDASPAGPSREGPAADADATAASAAADAASHASDDATSPAGHDADGRPRRPRRQDPAADLPDDPDALEQLADPSGRRPRPTTVYGRARRAAARAKLAAIQAAEASRATPAETLAATRSPRAAAAPAAIPAATVQHRAAAAALAIAPEYAAMLDLQPAELGDISQLDAPTASRALAMLALWLNGAYYEDARKAAGVQPWEFARCMRRSKDFKALYERVHAERMQRAVSKTEATLEQTSNGEYVQRPGHLNPDARAQTILLQAHDPRYRPGVQAPAAAVVVNLSI